MEGFREDYAETLRHWARRLDEHLDEAEALAGVERTRVWRLYLRAAGHGFAAGLTGRLPGTRPPTAVEWPDLADVAQLARASPCHGEGRGFESLHPLEARGRPLFVISGVSGNRRPRSAWFVRWACAPGKGSG